MKLAKKMLMLAILFAMFMPLTGCEGVGTTKEEMSRANARCWEYDRRMMMDDLALFAHTDRPRRASKWVID